jgi:hypothetical protein
LPDLDVIQPGIPLKDGCRVLTRIKAFIASEGVASTLEYTFRDRSGNPVDLTSTAQVSESGSIDFSESAEDSDTVLLRILEFTGINSSQASVKCVEGKIVDAVRGVVRATLPRNVYGQSGIYRLSWGFVRDGQVVFTNDGLLSVERTLFGFATNGRPNTPGPPTINELRMQIVDSSPAENQYLLDALEFDDDQIVMALTKPLQDFDEMNPHVGVRFDSRNFPWKSAWLDAAAGYLYQFAAAHYRRNKANLQGGGQVAGDKDKEMEYLRISKLHLDEWKEFRQLKKLAISMHECAGSFGSDYSRI